MNKSFLEYNKNGMVFYTIPSFDRTGLVTHAFSGRKGGVSEDSFASLNLSILTKEPLERVWENRNKFLNLFNIKTENLVGSYQVHKDRIYKVTKEDRGRGAFDPATVIPATDALMTNEKEVPLIAFFADCVPVFFLDPINKAVALAHAGWKGTVAKIAAKTAGAMKDAYGTESKDLLVAIGPSIGPCHYQVDEPVIEKVKEAFPLEWESLLTNCTDDGHGQLNLWEANRLQLLEVGIPNDNITIAGLCTYCHQDKLFSHRASMAGRQAAIIMLK